MTADPDADPTEALHRLKPTLGQWTYYYPFFPNTYCLAHHLTEYIFRGSCLPRDEQILHAQKSVTRDPWGWSTGSSQKSKASSLEIKVVATDEMRDDLSADHLVEFVPFTSYSLRHIFIHQKKLGERLMLREDGDYSISQLFDALIEANLREIYLVTDVPPVAKLFRDYFQKRCKESGVAEAPNMIPRSCGSRTEADFYDETAKIYIFGASHTHRLRTRSFNGGLDTDLSSDENQIERPRYLQIQANEFEAIKTEFAFVKNGWVDPDVYELVKSTFVDYYSNLHLAADTLTGLNDFQSTQPPDWWEGISKYYSRQAYTFGEPNPFLRAEGGEKDRMDADRQYLKIINHHYGGSAQ